MAKVKKDVFEALSDEFKSKVDGSTREELNAMFASIAHLEAENDSECRDDQDLATKREELKAAVAPYRDTSRALKLQREYLRLAAEARGFV